MTTAIWSSRGLFDLEDDILNPPRPVCQRRHGPLMHDFLSEPKTVNGDDLELSSCSSIVEE